VPSVAWFPSPAARVHPKPSPPRIDFSAELSIVLSEAERALGALNGIGRILTNPHLLIFPISTVRPS